LAEHGFLFEDAKKATPTGPLSGKIFCITGNMVTGPRETVAAKIEGCGGTVKSSVSKGVHYLVVGDGAGATKSRQAEKLGTACISEERLYQLMGLPMEEAPLPEID
jgi:DNA ligase (NAD+)